MQKTVPRAHSELWKWKQTYLSRATSPTKAQSTVSRLWRTRIPAWCLYRKAILSFFHNAFVFIFVITVAAKERLVVNVELGLMGIFILEWFFELLQMSDSYFACQKLNLLAIDGRCEQYTVRVHVFLMRILSACLSQLVVTVVQVDTATESRTDPTHTCGSRLTEHIVCVLPKNSHTSPRNVICYTSLDDTEHGHSFLTCPTSTCQRAQTLRRSTTQPEWRFGWAPILHNFWMTPRDGPFLSRIFCVAPRALGEFDEVIWSQVSFFPWNKQIFSDENLETQLNCTDSLSKGTDPFTPLVFDFLLGWASASTCRHLLPYLHPDSDLQLRHTGGCQKIHDGFVHFHQRKFRHGIFPSCSRRALPLSVPSLFVRERTIVLLVSDRISFQTRDHDGNYMSLHFEHCPTAFDWWHSLTFLSALAFSTFFDSWLLILFHYFVPGSEVSRPHSLIKMTSYWCLQSGTARLFVVSNVLLFIQSQYSLKLNRILQFWLVLTLHDHFRWYFTCC